MGGVNMTIEEILKEVKPQLEQAIQTAVESIYADVVGEHNPTSVVTAGSQGLSISIEDADVQQHLDYYEGRRKTKPTAMDNAEALEKQQQSIEDGTLHTKYVTPSTHEESLSRIRIPGSLQKYLKDVKIGGKM